MSRNVEEKFVSQGDAAKGAPQEPIRDPLLPGRILDKSGRPLPRFYRGQQSVVIGMGVHAHGSDELGR
jgi:hypothetical protein